MYSFSADVSCSNNLLVTFLSAARTIPSVASTPRAVPAWEMASRAYSTWYRRPSGEKMVVCFAHCQDHSAISSSRLDCVPWSRIFLSPSRDIAVEMETNATSTGSCCLGRRASASSGSPSSGLLIAGHVNASSAMLFRNRNTQRF